MAVHYSMSDAGAPTLEPGTSYAGARNVIKLLKACLVDGYGAKPAAGWSIIYEDTTLNKERIAFSNGNGVVELVGWASTGLAIFIWDSITTPGVGRVGVDVWDDVISSGANGWMFGSNNKTPMPGLPSDQLAGMYVNYFSSTYPNDVYWDIYADDKSFWLAPHYPKGHTNSDAGKSIVLNTAYHPQIFVGAIKSPELVRDQQGNFFCLFGSTSTPSGTPQPSVSQYIWGLRTPTGTIPEVANSPAFNRSWLTGSETALNPLDPVRILSPVMISYNGADVPKPTASLTPSALRYTMGMFPGVVSLSCHHSIYDFWGLWSIEAGAEKNLDQHIFSGIAVNPMKIADLNGTGFTLDTNWWA